MEHESETVETFETFAARHGLTLESHGYSATRLAIAELSPAAHMAWEIATREGYDSPFDWEFCPQFTARALLWSLDGAELPALRSEWRDLAGLCQGHPRPRAILEPGESDMTPETVSAIMAPLAQANANRKRAESAQDWTARAEAEAAQVAALPQVLAFLDARPVAHGLKVAPRPYVCRVCGNVESFSTNHTGPHYSACPACSWRGGRDDSGRYYSAQDKGRPHVYAGANPTGQGETNPHARPRDSLI